MSQSLPQHSHDLELASIKHPKTIALLGSTGYSGAELLRLLRAHPYVRIAALSSERNAGQHIGEVFPQYTGADLPLLEQAEQVDFTNIDLVFCALPHGTTQAIVKSLPKSCKVIDLSADFRLSDPQLYARVYGQEHQALDLQKEAVYGLSELNREAIRKARLIANPGCYPTGAQLPLVPLLKAGLIDPNFIIIDAKSGAAGAGRAVKQNLHFCELNDNFMAYGIGTHRHKPEIAQYLADFSGKEAQFSFTPHLVAMNRGIFSTIYVQSHTSLEALHHELSNAYADEQFVQVLALGQMPTTAAVRGTNNCQINVFADSVKGRFVLVSTIDNLCKGAAGQAVQNMNLMFGFAENTALGGAAIFP